MNNSLNPNSPSYIRNLIDLSLSALKINQLSTAWKYVNRASQIKSSSEIFFLKGFILEKMGDLKEAIFSYDLALKKEPEHKNALIAYLKLSAQLKIPTNPIKTYRAQELLVKSQFKDKNNFILASQTLLNSESLNFIGAVWKNKKHIVGWAVNLSKKNQPVEIRYEFQGTIKRIKADQLSPDLFDLGFGNKHNLFKLPLKGVSSNSLFYFPSGNFIPGSPIKVPNTADSIEIVNRDMKEKAAGLKKETLVSIVIPIYKDISSLKKCIDSIFKSKTNIKYKLVLINDASPEPKINQYLRKWSASELVTVLTNSINLGFVKSANKGLFYHGNSDCVLLNSDTEVNHYWLDRLYNAAYSEDDIATVTPLSNNSELTSFPIIHHNNSLPESYPWQKIDNIAAQINNKRYVEIPSGVGFCFYIKRACLTECGGLNEYDILRGYGDEAEFCSRIAEKGWKSVCSTNLYVAHLGGKSFNHEKRKLALENMGFLEKRYPDYKANYLQFIQYDPLRKFRYVIEKQLLSKYPKCDKLLLLGMEQSISDQELFEAINKNRSIYWFKPEYYRNELLFRLGRDRELTPANFIYRLPEEKDRLVDDLKNLHIPFLEYRDVLHYIPFLTDLPGQLKCPYSIYPNDYALVCPRIYLTKGGEQICSGPKFNNCMSCLEREGTLFEYSFNNIKKTLPADKDCNLPLNNNLTSDLTHMRIDSFIDKAQYLKVDSDLSASIFRQSFPKVNICINNLTFLHKKTIDWRRKKSRGDVLKVAIPHDVGAFSGFGLLLKLAKHVSLNNLNIEFLVFGHTINDSSLQSTGKVLVNKSLKAEDYKHLEQRYDCVTSLFLFRWPTPLMNELIFCLENNLNVAAYNVGLFAEQFNQDARFLLLPLDANIDTICSRLIKWSLNDS